MTLRASRRRRPRSGASRPARWGAAAILPAVCAAAGCTSTRSEVHHFGVMREVMREGRTEPRVALSSVVARRHAVGVGALTDLHGEITIIDGEVWIARVVDGALHSSRAFEPIDSFATLLTFSHVDRWREEPLPRAAEGDDLEALVESTARSLGVDTSRPFPVLIEGSAVSIDLHVINGFCPHAVDPAEAGAQPWFWSSDRPGHVLLVGFYAAESEGVMTHHGSSMHLHALVRDGERTITGHVDRVGAGAGTILRVPAAR